MEAIIEPPQEAAGGRKDARTVNPSSKPSTALHGASRAISSADHFPSSGSIAFTVWAEVARSELPGGRNKPDIDMVAGRFRQWAAEKEIPLKGAKILAAFEGFCRKWKIQR